MDYKAYRLEFEGAVHFGVRSLEDGGCTFCADTLFSALCQEALKMGEDRLQEFYLHVKEGRLLFSDAFPYAGSTFFLPKPFLRIETEDGRGDSVLKKAYKKLKYVPMNAMDDYLEGKYDVLHAPDMGQIGVHEMKVSASIRGEEETKPYRVQTFYFHPGNGLYVTVGYTEKQVLDMAEELLEGLSFCGIGGKKSAGAGRFKLLSASLPQDFLKRLQSDGSCYMSLSVSLPRDSELDASMHNAQYLLCRRSGFVDSQSYAAQQMRKRDLYVFQAGSCFRQRFEGDVYDVSGKGGCHPVYRYARPMFMEVFG